VGDFNPVHFDEEYVKRQGIFKGRLVHGILVGGLISTVAASKLPGPGSIYLSQSFKFVKPVYIGDQVQAIVTLKGEKKKYVYEFETIVKNMQSSETVIVGEATVYNKQVSIAHVNYLCQ